MKQQDKKQMILSFIRKNGVSSTRKIADAIKSNNNDALRYLNELLLENQIECIDVETATYWLTEFKQLPTNQTKEDIKEEIKKEVKQK